MPWLKLKHLSGGVINYQVLNRNMFTGFKDHKLQESADLEFVKKMLLLAARFDLPVLKMVSSGALVDKLISANQQSQNLSKNIHQEFLQLAEKIT